jgi:acetoin utilization protein AcuB
MTKHPIMIPSTTRAAEAQKIMAENNIRHLPVVGDGKRLVGLVTRQRLALKPDMLGSLNVWEITRYLAELRVDKVMVKADQVHTINPDRAVERAARMLAELKIGCLPVLDPDRAVVGIITEVDLLRSFWDMLGLPADGIRVTVRMPNRKGEFAKITSAVSAQGWAIMGIGSFPTPRHEGYYDVVLKIVSVGIDDVRSVLSQVPDQEIVDIREVV